MPPRVGPVGCSGKKGELRTWQARLRWGLARERQAVRPSQQSARPYSSRRAGRGRSVGCRLARLRLAGGMADSGREHKDVGRLKRECTMTRPVLCG
jgi:hypothetical protein